MSRLRRCVVALLCALVLVPAATAAHAATPHERQWGLDRIGAVDAWEVSHGEEVVVAVVDTGVDLTHPDLAPRLLRDGDGRVVGRDEIDDDHHPQDEHGHGTLVAGVAAAAGEDGGVAGAAPRARIMPVRVLDDRGWGTAAGVDAGVRWAVDHGADVINLSLESAAPVPGEVLATGPDDAVAYARQQGVAVVAAAGNSGTPFTDYRPSTPVLLVGATDREDRRAAFSDAGRDDMVLAPGVDIYTTACDPCGDESRHGYATASGTSFAAPHAAGALALLLASGLDDDQALQRLRETAVEVSGGGVGGSGHGRIDAAAAVGTTVADEDPDDTSSPDPEGDAGPPGQGAAGPGSQERGPTGGTGGGGETPAGTSEQPADESDGRAADESAEPAPENGDDADDTDPDVAPAQEAPGDDEASRSGERGVGALDVTPPDEGSGDRVGRLEGVAVVVLAVSLAAVLGARRRYEGPGAGSGPAGGRRVG